MTEVAYWSRSNYFMANNLLDLKIDFFEIPYRTIAKVIRRSSLGND